MSRRDTIIVAVLVNAALLMILFATAVRSDDAVPEQSAAPQLAKVEPVVDLEEDLLEQFVAVVPTLAEREPEPLPLTEEIEIAFTPPQPVVEKKPESKLVNVTVKKGDFLEKIASANNTSVSAIMAANEMSNTQLKIGQVLKVPIGEKKAKPAQKPAIADEAYYVVKDGDNPWLIASRNNIRLSELLRLNSLDEQKARRLRPGDRLRIR